MKRALLSVSNKEGIINFAKTLKSLKYEIISTGGTAKTLIDAGIEVTPIDQITGFPECLDGRVKTLHPKIHGGLLARRDLETHIQTCKDLNIGFIDVVAVNLYPFQETIQKPDVVLAEAIEQIDIGGPSMLRSAAKNHQSVTVLVDPDDYTWVAKKMIQDTLSENEKQALAAKVFAHTATYDMAIANYLFQQQEESPYPKQKLLLLNKNSDLRYGENPHQSAAFYTVNGKKGVCQYTQHHGKALSYNNMLDFEAAALIIKEFNEPAAVVIKHSNPCGAAQATTLVEAYKKALAGDPIAAFGGIIGLNREVDKVTASEISKLFAEVVVAPSYSQAALDILQKKANIRLISVPKLEQVGNYPIHKWIDGGFLIQDPDTQDQPPSINCVTQTPLSKQDEEDLLFANILVKYVKSNAIVIVKNKQLLGVGAGQMSRVKACEIALEAAGEKAKGAVLGSDAFFPFSDSIDLAAKAGIKAIIQPGGSKKDQDVIATCDQENIAMGMTNMRHFRH
ncbi:MAG: bifunctional phosphoribosylaminoimidazolecarboxamide formyltransferase/IMP cyclohydrolase [bacterium]